MQRYLALLACSIGIAALAHAQNCLPQGITLQVQADVDAFPNNHPGCTQIQGFLQIGFSNDANNDGIFDLSPLSQLTSVGGKLVVERTYGLESLAGLQNLTSVGGDLRIDQAYVLTDISALGNVTSVGGKLELRLNSGLSSLSGLGSVASIGGDLLLDGNGLTSLQGLGPVSATGGKLSISESGITDLHGLEGLVDIGGILSMDGNSGLLSMNGLAPSSVGGGLWVRNNPLLTDLSAATGLTGLGTYLNLQNNPSLSSLEELSGITSLGGYLRVQGSPLLTDLSPLAGIDPESITQLVLRDLPGVSDCAIASVCGFFTRPAPDATIANNAAGCASVAEVEAACGTTSIHDQGTSTAHPVRIHPNPSQGVFQLQVAVLGAVRLNVYDLAGRSVHSESTSASAGWTRTLELRHLLPGGYVLRLQSDQGISTARLIIQ